MELVARWAPIGLADALELLSPAFTNPEVGDQPTSLLRILLSPCLLHWPTPRDELRSCRSQCLRAVSQGSPAGGSHAAEQASVKDKADILLPMRAPCKPCGRKLSAHGADRVPQRAPHPSQKGLGRSRGSSAAVTNLG